MASGLHVNDKCLEGFNNVKNRTYRACVFTINDDMTEVQMDKSFGPNGSSALEDWKELEAGLPEQDCRYIIADFAYSHQGATKNRIVFLLWSPEYAKVRSKMIYASSQEGVVTKLEGLQRQLQITDKEELEYETIAKQLSSFTASY